MDPVTLLSAGSAIVGGLGSLFGGRSARKKREKLIKKMPKYQIADEAYQNQAVARSRAFGRDRSIQGQEAQVQQDAANAASKATQVSSSTSDILGTISAIQANTNSARRGLASDEAAIQQQNVGNLMMANSQMIDEKDKQFRQNQYAPWAAKMGLKTEQAQNNQNIFSTLFGAGLSGLSNAFTPKSSQ